MITDEWTSNYYHWHLIALHRLLILKKNNLIQDSILLLPSRYKKYSFVNQTLEKFGVNLKQILYIPRKSNIKVKNLLFVEASQNEPESVTEIFKILNQDLKKTEVNFGERIYISRAKANARYVKNEEELLKLLQKYDFKTVFMEDFSYQDQISIAANSKYIIGPHGAGLTNILFMKKNGCLFEMATKPIDQKPLTDYYKLCKIIGVKYFYQECDVGPESQDPHSSSMIVDIDKLEKRLCLMLEL